MRLLAFAVFTVALVILVVGWRATSHPSQPHHPVTTFTPGYG